MTESSQRLKRSSRAGIATVSTIALALGAFAVVGPGPVATEAAAADLSGGIRDKSGAVDKGAQQASDLPAGSCVVNSGEPSGNQAGFSWNTLEPSKTSPSKTLWGLSVSFDNSKDRTFADWYFTNSGNLSNVLDAGQVSSMGAGQTFIDRKVTHKAGESIDISAYGRTQRNLNLYAELTDEKVKQFASASADNPVRYAWQSNYKQDNPEGPKATQGDNAFFGATVNPWPSENIECNPITVSWGTAEVSEKHVIVPGEETKVGTINVPALQNDGTDDSMSRMVVEAYDGNGEFIGTTDPAVSGGEQLLRIDEDGNIFFTWPEYRGTDLATDKNVNFSVLAKPRTVDELQSAAKHNNEFGEEMAFDSSNSLDRYSKANVIDSTSFSLDDTEYHDPKYDKTDASIISGVDSATGPLATEAQKVTFNQVPDKIAELVKKRDAGGFEAEVTLDEKYVYEGWSVEMDEDYNVTVTAPENPKPGTFARPVVTVEYSNGSTDELELFVVVDPNNTQVTDLVRPGLTKGTIGDDLTAQIGTKPIMKGYKAVHPAKYEVDPSTVPDGWTVTVDNTGKVTAKADDTVAPGTIITPTVKATYPDETTDEIETQFQAIVDIKIPTYDTVTNKPNAKVTLQPSIPEVGLSGNTTDEAPKRYTFEDGETEYTHTDDSGTWTVKINENTGEITTTIPKTAPEGYILNVPVLAYYDNADKPQQVKGTVVVLKGDIAPVYSVESTGPNKAVDHQVQDAPEGSTFSFGKKPDGSPLTEMTTEDGWKYTIDPETGVVTSTPPAGSKPGDKKTITVTVDTPDGSSPKVPVTTVVQLTNSWEAEPSYPAETVYPGKTVTSPLTIRKPDGVEVATENPYAIEPPAEGYKATGDNNQFGNPTYTVTTENGDWIVGLDDNGNVVATAPETAKPGDTINVPVKVTYSDGSTDTVTAPIVVEDIPTPEGTFIPPLIKHVASEPGPVKFTPEYPNNMVPGSIRLLDGNKNEVNELVVVGQGTWKVDSNGEVTFTPEDGFTGNPTPVSYVATTTSGLKATVDNPGKFALTYQLPTTTTQTVTTQVPTTITTTAEGTPTTITTTVPTTVTNTATVRTLPNLEKVSNEPGKAVTFTPQYPDWVIRDEVQFIDGSGTPVDVLVVPGEGTWKTDSYGVLTFTPEEGFTGNPTAVAYTAKTNDGSVAQSGKVAVSYQAPSTTTATTTVFRTETVRTEVPTTITETKEVPTTVDGTPTTITETKEVPTTVTTAVPTTVTEVSKFYIPPVIEQVSNTPGEVKFTPKYLETMVPGSIRFLDGNKEQVQELFIDGQGTWKVAPNGEITFTPIDGYTDDPTPVLYIAERVDGTKARIDEPGSFAVRYQLPDTTTATATTTAQVPTTVRETETVTTTIDGTPTTVTQTNTVFIAPKLEHVASKAGTVEFTPDYPTNMKPGSVMFLDGNKDEVNELVVLGEGTWTVRDNGGITFEPAAGFTGNPTPVAYVATTNDGVKSSVDNPGKIALRYQLPVTETVTTEVPTTVVNTTTVEGTPTTFTETTQVPTTITTTANAFTLPDAQKVATEPGPVRVEPNYPADIDLNSVELVDRNGKKAQNVDVADEGTWSVDRNTGFITFKPVAGFTGDPTPIAYTAKTSDGVVASNNGKVRVSYQLPVTTTVTTAVPTTLTETVVNATTVEGTPTTITETKEVPTTVPTTVVTTVPMTVTNMVLNLPNIEKTAREAGPFEFTPRYGRSVDTETVRFIDGEGNRVNVLQVKGNGTWTVDREGKVKFTPEDGFTGNPVPVSYIASTRDGVEAAAPATMTLEYELPVTETQTATESTTVRDTVWVEKPTTIISEIPTTVVTEVPTTVTTQVPTTVTTEIPATVTTAVPTTVNVFVLSDIKHVAREAGRQEFTPRYPRQVDRNTVRFVDRRGQETQVFYVEGQGTWTVDNDGKITFNPIDGFTGNPTPVPYIASTSDGVKAAETADISIFYELPSTEVVTTTETTERLVTTTVPTEVTTTVPTTVTTQVPTTITTVIPTTVTSNVPTTIPTTVMLPPAPTETTPTVVKPGASSDGSSAQAKSVVERCFGNAVRSPILWLLPIGILGAVGGKVLEPYMAAINQEFGALNAEINRRVQDAMPDFGFGGHGGNNEHINQLMAQVDAANRQLQAFAGQPGVQQIGQAIGVIAALAAISGVLYDWCSADVGQAKTAIDFDEGSSSRR